MSNSPPVGWKARSSGIRTGTLTKEAGGGARNHDQTMTATTTTAKNAKPSRMSLPDIDVLLLGSYVQDGISGSSPR